jgi:hypothetical protein
MEKYIPIDLDVPAVKIIMDWYGIHDYREQLSCFERVRSLFFKMKQEKGP